MINLRWTQLHAGTEHNILHDTHSHLAYLPRNRITWIRTFLSDIDGRFEMESEIVPPKNCVEDEAIMDILRNDRFNDQELKSINNTRLLLQVYWITDAFDPFSLRCDPYYTFHHHILPSK